MKVCLDRKEGFILTIQENKNRVVEPSQIYRLHREEKQYTTETHNQTELRIKEITGLDVGEFIHPSSNNRTGSEFVNIKKELFFKSNGYAHIIFDVHKLKFFTIATANPNSNIIHASLLVSPDNAIYASLVDKRLINQGKLEILECQNRLQFIKVEFFGKPGDKAFIFLQGQK